MGASIQNKYHGLLKNDKEIFRGTKKEVDELAEKLKNLSDKEAKKYIDELVEIKRVRKILDDFIQHRNKLLKLNKKQLLHRFKNTLKVHDLKADELLNFYLRMNRKYPKLKKGINMAEFIIDSKAHKNFKVLSHSGFEQLYKNFTKTIKDDVFLKNVKDLDGKIKWNDSEVKFIYEFLTKHIHKADDFVIETRNIYFTCTSCQRELIMLIDYAKTLGKKIEFRVYSDENIKGYHKFVEFLRKNLKK